MPKQFEFRIEGNEKDFVEFLEKNNIPYTRLPKVHSRIATTRKEEKGIVNIMAKTTPIDQTTLEMVKIFIIPLTLLVLDKTYEWYKERRKRKGSRIKILCNDNLLDLDARGKRILMSALKEDTKAKKKRKRAEPK